ncbi:DNA mismatch repair protein [Algoriphagus sp.]|uniref:MutS-related protein n=1 Tax=Algoriphagus sp. TaxID=1872435 RepID=UPI00262BBCF0|nr:DNA mismatch repair protein [Algoriphagus sp.]
MNKFNFSEEDLQNQISKLNRQAGLFSLIRLVLFLGLIAAVVLFFSHSGWWFFILLGLTAGFVWSVRRFNFIKDQESITTALQQMKLESTWRKNRKLDQLEEGKEFREKNHPFANDLDLFGEHSLFQLVNHCSSTRGKKLLAHAMKAAIQVPEKTALREAIDELGGKPLFLKSMESVGKAFFDPEQEKIGWTDWLKEKESPKSFLLVLGWIGLMGGITVLTLVYLGLIPSAILGLWVLIGLFFLGMVFKSLKTAAEKIPNRQTLKTFVQWVQLIEAESFQSDFLKREQALFKQETSLASEQLMRLDRLGLWIQNRLNLLYLPVNLIFWTDLILYGSWVKWKNSHGVVLADYPEKLAYWEVLVSLGLFQSELGSQGKVHHSHQLVFRAKDLTHPLLLPEKAVSNSFSLGDSSQVVLLTGANMSGKTTFMRTLGINLVLVNLGLRPFGTDLTVGEFDLYTSMRNTDNLGESVSSFYAELSRIKTLIHSLESGKPIFFLLDEILKGTNTEDRIAGSEALIAQLLKTQGLGIISTHDIELASMENRMKGVRNFSFHSAVFDDKIDFDYQIKEGACPSFNAHKLMELMGIKFR